MKINSTLFRGCINRDLRVTYLYKIEEDEKYQTIFQKNDTTYLSPAFSITIGGKFGDPRIFIPSSRYYSFTGLLNKTVKLISENLIDLFPDVGKIEFEVDQRMLERFKTEKAMTTNGITMSPDVWSDATDGTVPGLKIESTINDQSIIIPFEDAISISEMFNTFDPHIYGLSVLRIMGKID